MPMMEKGSVWEASALTQSTAVTHSFARKALDTRADRRSPADTYERWGRH